MRIGFALVAALTLVAGSAQAQKGKNWDATFGVTDEGTHVAGNPQAAIKLIEFVSYSCVHCANFVRQADGALRMAYVQPGRMQVEVRHVIRNPVDLAAALLTECGPPAKFFGNHRLMMLRHDEWMAKAVIAGQAQQQRWSAGPFAGRMQAIAGDLDFYELMQTRGYGRPQMDRCLGDEAKARIIATRSQEDGARFGVEGTPSFVLNGKLLPGVHDWAGLQRALEKP